MTSRLLLGCPAACYVGRDTDLLLVVYAFCTA